MMRPHSAPPLTLPAGHAHLWWAVPDRFTDPNELARYRSVLTEDERQKTDRFRFARDQQLCLSVEVETFGACTSDNESPAAITRHPAPAPARRACGW